MPRRTPLTLALPLVLVDHALELLQLHVTDALQLRGALLLLQVRATAGQLRVVQSRVQRLRARLGGRELLSDSAQLAVSLGTGVNGRLRTANTHMHFRTPLKYA